MGSRKHRKKMRAPADTAATVPASELNTLFSSELPHGSSTDADSNGTGDVFKTICSNTAIVGTSTDNFSEKPETSPEVAKEQNITSDSDGGKDVPQHLSRFAESLEEFSFDDTGASSRPKRRGPDIVRLSAVVIMCAICAVSTFYLLRNIYDKYRSERIYSNIASGVDSAFNIGSDSQAEGGIVTLLTSDTQTPYTPTMEDIIKNGLSIDGNQSERSYAAELERMRASLNSLKNINPDIYAWIRVPGTSINYPVAQRNDNVYYLDHAYTGDNLVNGSIFADYRCSPYIPNNRNTVMYGHNITSGAMFHAVEDFFREDVFKNTKIYVYTFDGVFIFKPFSIHETSYDSGFIDTYFESDEAFVSFLNELRDGSDISSDAELTSDSRILTMSTCTNGVSTRRYALHSVLVESITK